MRYYYRKRIKKLVYVFLGIIVFIFLFKVLSLKPTNVIFEPEKERIISFENSAKSLITERSYFELIFLKKKIVSEILEKNKEIREISLRILPTLKIKYLNYEPIFKICKNFCALVSKEGTIFPLIKNIELTVFSEIDFDYGQEILPQYLKIKDEVEKIIRFNSMVILENGDLKIIGEDITILFDPNQDIDNQIKKLKILRDKIPNTKYIDLRIKGKIFFY